MKKLSNILFYSMMILLFIFIAVIVYKKAKADELTIFTGTSISNSVTDEHSTAWGVEQLTKTKYGLYEFGYLNEGHQGHDKRDGIYALYKFPNQLTERLETSFSIGPYFTSTTITEPNEIDYQDHYSWALLGNASVKYKIDSHWSLQARWGHVIYAVRNKDADLFLLGAGYKF